MAPKDKAKIPDKLTDSEKKKIKQENKAKANPQMAAAKKEKSDAKRERRAVSARTPHSPAARLALAPLQAADRKIPLLTHPCHTLCLVHHAGVGQL